jgi:hypothetical protein
MILREDFLSLQFFVFSSHKTMTQSLTNTLNMNGLKAIHCHRLSDLDLTKEDFLDMVDQYNRDNQHKLSVISIYRDPLDRFFSSFFQALSVDRFGRTELGLYEKLNNFHESVLYSEQLCRIQERFWYYCARFDSDDGVAESLKLICDIFNVQINEIHYRNDDGFTRNEFNDINLFVARFDILRENFIGQLSKLVGRELKGEGLDNMSSLKWYAPKYREFLRTISVPGFFIYNLYNSRRKLNDVFYPGLHEKILAEKLERYSLSRQRLAAP